MVKPLKRTCHRSHLQDLCPMAAPRSCSGPHMSKNCRAQPPPALCPAPEVSPPNTPVAALPLRGAATTDLQLTCTRVPVVLSEASDPSTPSPTTFTSSVPPYLHAVGSSRATGGHCISLATAVQFSIFHFHSKKNCFTTTLHSLLEQSRVLSPC